MHRFAFLFVVLVLGCSRTSPVQEISVVDNAFTELAPYEPHDLDWPAWRGPDATAASRSIDAPVTWSATENVVWKTMVPGRGHGSPTVRENLVLLATATENEQIVLAYDRATGEEIWNTAVHESGFPSDRQMHNKSTHANATVACDDRHAFVAFLNQDSIVATAFDFQGKIVWQTRLGAFDSKFGYAPSPLVYKSLVIFAADNQGGGYLVAVHRESGEIVWRKARPAIATYSSPIVAHVSGRDQLLISGCDIVASYDPNTGEPNWTAPGTTTATCGTIVWNATTVFAAGGYPNGRVVAIEADGSGTQLWSTKAKLYEPSMLVVGHELYGVTDSGIAHCWDTATGKLNWKKRLGGGFSASPVYCNGNVYVPNLDGKTFVFKATPDGYENIATNQLGTDTYITPAICGQQIFMRVGEQSSDKRQEWLYCIGKSEPQIVAQK